jgi:hypothetical protein
VNQLACETFDHSRHSVCDMLPDGLSIFRKPPVGVRYSFSKGTVGQTCLQSSLSPLVRIRLDHYLLPQALCRCPDVGH